MEYFSWMQICSFDVVWNQSSDMQLVCRPDNMDSSFKVGAFYLTSYTSLFPYIFLATRIIKRTVETMKTGN